jgi:NAD(P)-dependent dehydrogenase (short-subunit alcohol dehydrogenase family)
MLLQQKSAVIHGAGGAVGAAVARAFAHEGASVHLAGRSLETLMPLADEIDATSATVVDAFSEAEVEAYAAKIGPVDVGFNAVGLDHHMGRSLLDLTEEEFLAPFTARVRTTYLTTRATARHMVAAGRQGALLMITATPARTPERYATSFGPACAAVEGLARSFAAELGPHGIRVVTLRSAGSGDSPGVVMAMQAHASAKGISLEEQRESVEAGIMLRRMPLLAELGNAAAFYASDHARALTATVANLTGGASMD